MTPRDNQRQRLYEAERTIAAWTDSALRLPTVPQMQTFIDDLNDRRWVQARWGYLHIEVRAGQGHRRAVSYGNVLHMPKWSRTQMVLLHELAHSLTPNRFAPHGPEFAGVFLALVENVIGRETATEMRQAFRAKRVRWNNNGIPTPSPGMVRTKKADVERERAQQNRLPTDAEMVAAAETIRRAVRNGLFGEASRKPRVHALATARGLDDAAKNPRWITGRSA